MARSPLGAAGPGRSLVGRGSAREQLSRTSPPRGTQHFLPLPAPTGPFPYRLGLETILSATHADNLDQLTSISFHVIGDSGGVKLPVPQQIVADVMSLDVDSSDKAPPLFCYHVGDVVYYDGATADYYSQFYEPYEHYRPPIVGIAGNHDLGPVPGGSEPPGTGFVRTFCSTAPQVLPEARDAPRTTMVQPNVYWTLRAPLFTLVGMATNVPEHGEVDATQVAWLVAELRAAPADRALLVALHHPPYSADAHHGGSERMVQLLDQVFADAGRLPDMVLSGHVHNYQRFTRGTQGRQIPYLVVGASGYWHLHNMAKVDGKDLVVPWDVPDSDVTLDACADDRHGFLRLTVTKSAIKGAYTTVPRPHESWSNGPVKVVDGFSLSTKTHKVTNV